MLPAAGARARRRAGDGGPGGVAPPLSATTWQGSARGALRPAAEGGPGHRGG
ncbi:MAG: hypothetical protein AVDCRST_MAG13-2 [uncultured Solirubrobacteraceae bacterium]|uniref:Uncharacterized protein n=1 Tax=uncultured Solirubrobacteraceae bacterium TaxID=1162706 RepID=A0A6J4RCT0_9ACTN|nr:MAG: hypothetical protein AVDCRST_MAG13-2 [uncultured Solirubrobacteraceae bacterium]